MTTTKKLVVAVVALSLALVTVIGGTLAFLLDESNVVTNKFTYGKIEIVLTENNKADQDGLEFTNVVPGDVLEKDPIVTVNAGSEACYVYVLIDNQLGDAASYNIDTTKWIHVQDYTNATKKLYRYYEVVNALQGAKDLTVFSALTFRSDLTSADLTNLEGKNVVITAYAYQAENLAVTAEASITAANNAAKTWAATK